MEILNNSAFDSFYSQVIDACKVGNIAVLSSVSDGNAILNEIEKFGESPLVVACQYGHIGIVRHILQHEFYVIDPQILAKAASASKESGEDQIRSLLTLYYIKYCRYSA